VCVRKYWSFIGTNFGLSRYRKKAGLVSASLEDGCRGVNLYSLQNIISTTKCSKIRWAGRVERIGGENFMQRFRRQAWNTTTRNSAVSIMRLGYGLAIEGSWFVKWFYSVRGWDRLWDPLNPLSIDSRAFTCTVKQPGHEVQHAFLTSYEFENEWSHATTSSMVCRGTT
jgi:hypothetical protein